MSEREEDILNTISVIKSGYAGIMPNGNIVDRRIYPEANEIPANPMFCAPEPKDPTPCNLDHNNECLVCDCWPSECSWLRLKNKDFKYESEEELRKIFKNAFEGK